MMGEWYELDLNYDEDIRLRRCASREGMSPEEWISRIVRGQIVLGERLDARIAKGPHVLDTRNESQGDGLR